MKPVSTVFWTALRIWASNSGTEHPSTPAPTTAPRGPRISPPNEALSPLTTNLPSSASAGPPITGNMSLRNSPRPAGGSAYPRSDRFRCQTWLPLPPAILSSGHRLPLTRPSPTLLAWPASSVAFSRPLPPALPVLAPLPPLPRAVLSLVPLLPVLSATSP